jgi:hypothetical protein
MSPIDLGTGIERILVFLFGGSTLGLIALLSRHYLTRDKQRNEAKASERKNDLDVEVHRDSLTIQLLETARSEVAALRVEVERLRPNEAHIRHFEMALNHLERMLLAENDPERKRAERGARAFVNRMRRLAEARGVIANEVQLLESRTSIADQADEDERRNG